MGCGWRRVSRFRRGVPMADPAPHLLPLRVYYEDTDFAGIVYHANYLKFIERGRSEWIRSLGIDQLRLKAETGQVFAVRRIEADFLRPAVFDDQLLVETRVEAISGARIVLVQSVSRQLAASAAAEVGAGSGGAPLFTARVTLAMMAADGGPVRIAAEIRAAITGAGQ